MADLKTPNWLMQMFSDDSKVSSGRVMFVYGCICFSGWITWSLLSSIRETHDIAQGVGAAMVTFAGLVGGVGVGGKVTEWLKSRDTTPPATDGEPPKDAP